MTTATSDDLCTLLDHMSWGHVAAHLSRPHRPVRMHSLPPTMWVRPEGRVGGSKAAATGLLPAAVSWQAGAVFMADPDAVGGEEVRWEVDGAGAHLAGSIRLTEGPSVTGRPSRNMWDAHSAPVLTSHAAGRALDALIEQGELAKWSMLQRLEEFAHAKVQSIATSICREVADVDDESIAPSLLDAQQLDLVVTNVVYGTHGDSSRILRCLDRCLDPATTRRVDPIRYLTTQIRRDLGDEVRVAIGDPQVGSRVRRVARGLGTGATLERIVDRYNEVHSSDRISTSRAVRALTVAPSIESVALPIGFEVSHV